MVQLKSRSRDYHLNNRLPVPVARVVALGDVLMLLFMLGAVLVGEYPVFSRVNRVVGLSLVVLSLLLPLLLRFRDQPRIPPEILFFGCFAFWSGVTGILVATAMDLAWDWIRLVVQIWALAFAVTRLAIVKKSATSNFVIIVGCAVLAAAYSRISGTYGQSLDMDIGVRVQSLVNNANAYAFVMLCGIIAIVFLLATTRRLYLRIPLLFLVIPFELALVSSGSRKAFLIMCLFTVAWLGFCYSRYIFQKLYVAFLISAILFGLYCFGEYVMQETYLGKRLEITQEDPEIDESRAYLYKRAFEVFLEHPIRGVGLGNFQVSSGVDLYSHSEYMEVLSTTGLVGAALYFPIYLILWSRLARLHRMTTDPRVRYQLGLFKAIVIAMLAWGLGAANFASIPFWFMVSGIIGYSHSLELTFGGNSHQFSNGQ